MSATRVLDMSPTCRLLLNDQATLKHGMDEGMTGKPTV